MPRLKLSRAQQLLCAAAFGAAAGCAVWWGFLASPSPVRLPPMKPGASKAAMLPDPGHSLSSLLTQPIGFVGVGLARLGDAPAQATLPPSGVRVLGLSRGAAGARALVAAQGKPALWLAPGSCQDQVCLVSVGRSNARLRIGGELVTAELFDSEPVSGTPAGASVSPIQPLATSGGGPAAVGMGPVQPSTTPAPAAAPPQP